MRILAALASLSLSFSALSAGSLTTLDVQENVVFFETSETKATSLSCVSADNAALYSLSLTSDSGKAMYAMLMTAMASGKAIEVTSAGDCGVVDKVERAASIKFSEASMATTSKARFKGTILESAVYTNGALYNLSENMSSSPNFFLQAPHSSLNRGISGLNALNRKNHIGSVNATGWLTAVILPEFVRGTNYTLFVEIDGVTYSFTGEYSGGARNGRPVWGAFSTPHVVSRDNLQNMYYPVLKTPEEVISLGKGVPFYRSLRVFYQFDTATAYLDRGIKQYASIDFMYGNPQ
ncbi:hypothetical protein OE749_01650 [Aestuariibacter sp. AA17]|uniref:Spore coat protein U domain-containing protein n=1 Tax=Fluctibacter corallii TaxID=2984329 RepID=A0ABT3A3Y1_9ALTE|nr:hypothetical protein [Aestuariibacter sp. AA17]MCV2883401.1 hypothetical protein [Aestuariibacter sp. AA17]